MLFNFERIVKLNARIPRFPKGRRLWGVIGPRQDRIVMILSIEAPESSAPPGQAGQSIQITNHAGVQSGDAGNIKNSRPRNVG